MRKIIDFMIKHHMIIFSAMTVTVCCIRFLFDNVDTVFMGQPIKVGHTDSMAYTSIMGPMLAAHGYVKGKIAGSPAVKND